MTRRIVITIVVNVWLVLIAAGCSTYYITRSLLIEDLDETIVSRVASLPDIERPASLPRPTDQTDRFAIRGLDGRNLNSMVGSAVNPAPTATKSITVQSRKFSRLADQTWLRTLTIAAFMRPDPKVASGSEPIPVIVVYSVTADHVESLLNNLLYSLGFFAVLAAVATAVSAYSVARAALRPMRDAADVIGTIDERSLNRRISVEKLPSELVPVGRRLNAMLARLEIAFSQRRQFLADASHELRTPVAALVTTLEVALRRKREPEDYVKALDRCLSDARLLHQLVVALLDQARAERFNREPELGPVAISSVLRECAGSVETLAVARGLSLECNLPDNLIVLADEQMIRSSVGNLLSNAIEYTPNGNLDNSGRIEVSVEAIPEGEGTELPAAIRSVIPDGVHGTPCRLRIRVKDNGPGIAKDHIKSIFEPFYRADAARVHAENHLGLGLALVQTQVRALGGECKVESPPPGEERGCLFTLELPTIEVSSPPVKAINTFANKSRVSPQNIA